MYDLLIQGCLLAEAGLPHDIGIQGDRIAAFAPAGQLPGHAAEVIDATGMVALPGLINAHAHAAMVLLRGAAEDVPVESWFNDYIWPMETNLTPEDVYWGAMLAAAEMIEAGVTTVADHYFAMDAVAQAILDSGMRGHLAPTLFGQAEAHAELDQAAAFAARWHSAAGGRIRAWLGPHSPYLCPPEFLREVAAETRTLGLGCHIHVSETAQQVQASVERHGLTPIRLLERLGLLEQPLLCAHAAHATPDEIALLAERQVGVAHCPKTFLKLAAGIAPIEAMRAAGVPLGLGSDGAASNNTLDIFEQLRLAALLQKHTLADAQALPVGAALALASQGGAQALGQAHELGRLAPGALADLILVRLDGAHMQPIHNLVAALVYSARAGDVDSTIVAGRVLMRGRRLLTIDKPLVLREAQMRAARLRERGHGRRLQTYAF